ncbi:hypothetical protein D924_02268 [Enterococcus faecalis 06-MB-S-10]|nr:hypothetical protein D924_02268 [Enterococcus faecalis 06-MB-S-10]
MRSEISSTAQLHQKAPLFAVGGLFFCAVATSALELEGNCLDYRLIV